MTNLEERLEALQTVHKIGHLCGIEDTLNALEGVGMMLGPGTGYEGDFPDALAEWCSQQRDRLAVMREMLP